MEKDLTLLQPYCENDMRKLKKMSKSIFMRFNEPLTGADYDDFYSLANLTLWQAYNAYNPDAGVSFEGFLYSCLQKKFKSELTNRHRQKRVLNQLAVSLDAAIEDEDKCSLMDIIPSDFDTFEEMIERQERDRFKGKIQIYLSKLSSQQISILNFLMDGFKAVEIREILNISEKQYADDLQIVRCYENVKILF